MPILKKLYDVPDLINAAFGVFFKNIANLFWFQLISLGVIAVGSAPFAVLAFTRIFPLFKMVQDNMPKEQQDVLYGEIFKVIFTDPAVWGALAFAVIIMVAAGCWRMCAASAYLEDKLLGRDAGVMDSIKKVQNRVLPFLVTFIGVGLAVYAVPLVLFAGSVFAFSNDAAALGALLILAGFFSIFAVLFVFVLILPLAQVVALKGKDYLDAVKYAARLVRGGYWPTVGYVFLIICVMMGFGVVAWIVQVLIQLFGWLLAAVGAMVSPFFGVIVMVLVFVVMLVMQLIPQCYIDVPLVMYYVNREAFKGDGQGVIAEAAKAEQQTNQTNQI